MCTKDVDNSTFFAYALVYGKSIAAKGIGGAWLDIRFMGFCVSTLPYSFYGNCAFSIVKFIGET